MWRGRMELFHHQDPKKTHTYPSQPWHLRAGPRMSLYSYRIERSEYEDRKLRNVRRFPANDPGRSRRRTPARNRDHPVPARNEYNARYISRHYKMEARWK